MNGRLKAHNFFVTTLAAQINDTSLSGSITIEDKIVNGITLEDGAYIFWMLVGLNNPSELEIFRITNVSGTTLTYDKRISPNGLSVHPVGDLIQCNDMGEFINMLSDNIDYFGYTETVSGSGNELKVKVYGGRIFHDSLVDTTIGDTTLTLTDNTINYVYYDDTSNAFGFTPVEPGSYYVLAKVTTSGGVITDIEDYRAKLVAGGGGGGGGGGHVIKSTDQGGTATTLTQRDTIRTKKLKTTDDSINLETIIEGKRIATPNNIPVGETEYIEDGTQMIVSGAMTIDGTLDIDGSGELVII